jgi:hypothetical protein
MGQKQQIRNRKLRQSNEPAVPKRSDELGDAFPNDWLEALIILVAIVGIFGGAVGLYHLAQVAQ